MPATHITILLLSSFLVSSLLAAESADPLELEIQRLRQECRSPEAKANDWVQLGDAFMQQSRSRSPESFYNAAEQAYRCALQVDEQFSAALVGLAWVENSRHHFAQG